MPDLETIYLVLHSHTDIGYTHDQPILWELERRFIDEAIDLAEQYAGDSGDHAFRWNVETIAPLLYWLERSTDKQIERFIQLEKAKRIEVTGLYANMTPLVDIAQWIELVQPIHALRRDYGFTIQNAMNCDVNGHNWSLTDILLDAGISGFSMAINEHSGGAPLNRPNVFKWQSPSGRALNTLNGWHYHMGNWLKIGRDMNEWETFGLPFVRQRLQEVNWPLPFVMIQLNHPFGDNGSAYHELPAFIQAWNEKNIGPRIQFATLQDWWSAVAPYTDQLSTVRGDWTDFWNYGCGSSARETTINRASRSRLLSADALFSSVKQLPTTPARDTRLTYTNAARIEAWHALSMYDEHTWGADISVSTPNNDDTASQWYHKGIQAYKARSLSLMLQRDSLAEFAQHIPAQEGDALIVYNPLPWSRRLTTPLHGMIANEEIRGTADDPTSSRHHQDRLIPSPKWWARDVEVPAFGYTVITRDQLVQETSETSDTQVIETAYHRITFDTAHGGLKAWYDKTLQRDLIDSESAVPFGGVVYERIAEPKLDNPRRAFYEGVGFGVERAGWKRDWVAERWSASAVISHQVQHVPNGWLVTQVMTVPELASPVTLRVFIPEHETWVQFEAEWSMGLNTQPESTYVALPFALPQPTARFDIGGQSVEVEHDQFTNSCKDYFTVQRWVDLSNSEWGVVIACPDNPMVQVGDFTYGHDLRDRSTIEKGLFLGWVTNNYWETNFRGHQPGLVTARYIVQPHNGAFNEAQAHQFGLEHSLPIIAHSRFERPRAEASLPRQGSMLNLPDLPILTLHTLSDPEDGLLVRLLNTSDRPQQAAVANGLLHINAVQVCDIFGQSTGSLDVIDGKVTVMLEPRQIQVLRLKVTF